MTREQALSLLNQHIEADNLIKHCLASEAIMRRLARRLGHDEDKWGLAGLLRDLDYNETRDNPARHGLRTAELLEPMDVDPDIVQAIKAHNAEALGLKRESPLDLALTCAETMTGMVIAAALVYPDRKIKSVKPKSITKRMKEKQFARNVNRDLIMLCEDLGLSLNEFAELSLEAMAGIDAELGL